VYNGGRLSGGGRVSSSFSAEPRVLAPDYKKPVYFVVVAADEEAAAVFIYRVPLQQLKDVKFLRSVAEEVFYSFHEVKGSVERGMNLGEYFASIDELVNEVVAEYKAVSRHVELLGG
jgi:hypothetical protein